MRQGHTDFEVERRSSVRIGGFSFSGSESRSLRSGLYLEVRREGQMQRNVSVLFHVAVPNSAPRGLSILSAVIAHGAVATLHDVRQVSRSSQKPCGCRHLQSPSSVIGVIASHLPLCTECCLKSPSLMPSVFSGSGRRTLHTLHQRFLIGEPCR